MEMEWRREWSETQHMKGKAYVLVQPTLEKSPWYNTAEYTRTPIITDCVLDTIVHASTFTQYTTSMNPPAIATEPLQQI